MGFQAALARLLVEPDLRARLGVDEVEIQRRFSLSDSEFRALRALDRSRLQLMVEAVAGKRLQLLRQALPHTTKILESAEAGRLFLRDFFSNIPPLIEHGSEMAHNRLLADSRRLADCVRNARIDGVPEYLCELASYEAVKVGLSFSLRARASADAALPANTPVTDSWRPRLGDHVLLRTFRYDFLFLASDGKCNLNAIKPKRQTTHVAFYRQAGSLAISTYRLGRVAIQTLQLCDGTRSLSELLAEVIAGEVGSERASRSCDVVRLALDRGYLVAGELFPSRVNLP